MHNKKVEQKKLQSAKSKAKVTNFLAYGAEDIVVIDNNFITTNVGKWDTTDLSDYIERMCTK